MSSSGATGVTAARQVVEALAEHEDAIGDLYEAYGVCFADAASFWRGLSAEEYGHGSLMRDLASHEHEHELDVFVDTKRFPLAELRGGDARRARPDRGRRGQPAHARPGAADRPRLRAGDRRARRLPGIYERLAQRGPRAQPSARLVGAAPRRHQGAPDAPAALGGRDRCRSATTAGWACPSATTTASSAATRCAACRPRTRRGAAGAAAQQPPPPPRHAGVAVRCAPLLPPSRSRVGRPSATRPRPPTARPARPSALRCSPPGTPALRQR